MFYYISCGFKPAPEKKNDEDEETQTLLKNKEKEAAAKETATKEVRSWDLNFRIYLFLCSKI